MYSSSSLGAIRTVGAVAADGVGRGWVGRVDVTLRTSGRPRPRRVGAAMVETCCASLACMIAVLR